MRLLVLAAAAVTLAGCTVDKGRCLQSHVRHHAASMQMIPITSAGPNGTVTVTLMPVFYPESDETVCDRWEFPEGKPK